MSLADIDRLSVLHQTKRFELATTNGLQGAAELGGDRQALVTELLDQARFAARIRQLAEIKPNARASALVRDAELSLRPLP